MSKRKELILKAIYAHTLECLEDKQYDKLGMDASSLAMDLRLDRSNVSRDLNLLHQEGTDEKGHLEHTLHLIGDLHDLHLQLMKLPVGEHYRRTYARLEPELPRLRAVLGNPGMNDTELCFRALYAAMLYRIKGEGEKSAVADTLEFISPVIAELADMHGKVERGEVDLFKTAEGK